MYMRVAKLTAMRKDAGAPTAYIAFKRIKNFACVEVYPQAGKVTVFLKVAPDIVTMEDGFTRDVHKVDHFGTGDLEVTLRTPGDLQRTTPLLVRNYEGG